MTPSFLLNGVIIPHHDPKVELCLKSCLFMAATIPAGMFLGQFVTLGADALRCASNLIGRFENVQAAAASCSGWWLGQVVAIVTGDGREEEPPHISALLAMEQADQDKRRGTKRKQSANEGDHAR